MGEFGAEGGGEEHQGDGGEAIAAPMIGCYSAVGYGSTPCFAGQRLPELGMAGVFNEN